MSAAKRRVKRQLARLVKLDRQVHSYRVGTLELILKANNTQRRVLVALMALGHKLQHKGLRKKAEAALDIGRAAPGFGNITRWPK